MSWITMVIKILGLVLPAMVFVNIVDDMLSVWKYKDRRDILAWLGGITLVIINVIAILI